MRMKQSGGVEAASGLWVAMAPQEVKPQNLATQLTPGGTSGPQSQDFCGTQWEVPSRSLRLLLSRLLVWNLWSQVVLAQILALHFLAG